MRDDGRWQSHLIEERTDDRLQVLVAHNLLLVGHGLGLADEGDELLVVAGEVAVAQVDEPLAVRGLAREFAEDDGRVGADLTHVGFGDLSAAGRRGGGAASPLRRPLHSPTRG